MTEKEPPYFGMRMPEGGLERPIAWTRWYVPHPTDLRISNGKLLWRPGGVPLRPDRETGKLLPAGPPAFGHTTRPGPQMLLQFASLAEAPDERIEQYARQWGVLEICKHGLPASHNRERTPWLTWKNKDWCEPLRRKDGWCWEPLETWRKLASEARAILKVAAQLHEVKPGTKEDWQVIFSSSDELPSPWLGEDDKKRWRWNSDEKRERVATGRLWLSKVAIRRWLDYANVVLDFTWGTDGKGRTIYDIDFGGGLFPALAVQLILAVARSGGLAFCFHCREAYFPEKRAPKAGQRSFCPECRKKEVPKQYANRDYKKRLRSKTRFGKAKTLRRQTRKKK